MTGFPLPASPQDPQGGDHDGEQRDGGRVPRLLRHPPQPVQRERAVRHPAGEAAVQLDAGDQKGHGTTSGLPSATTATVTTVQTRLEQNGCGGGGGGGSPGSVDVDDNDDDRQ